MPTPSILGSSWSISVALTHVERVEHRDHARSFYRALRGGDHPLAETPELTTEAARAVRLRARDGLLLALRDGYIRATGRLSTTAALFPAPRSDRSWRLHSSDPSLITTTEWRTGEFGFSRWDLTGPSWEYIQIEVPDFMVKAIWPDHVPEQAARPAPVDVMPQYTTPYLELMQAAISRFAITVTSQEKKEGLSAWFRTQQIEGEPVSKNLADAMATLVRLPAAQRGGAKRVLGPDFRRVG